MALAFALDRALGVPKGRPLVQNVALSIVMLPIVGVLLVVAIALPALFSIVASVSGLADPALISHVLAYVLSIALVFIVTVVLYRWLPYKSVSWGYALRGATVVAAAWPIVQYAFAQYVTHVDFTHVYGALTAPLVLLLWFYFIGSIFLFGAEYGAASSSRR
jgi:membrane protein